MTDPKHNISKDVLGEGGMGSVYLAEQQQPVRRRVALKVIKAGMDSKDVIARFEAERQALAMMAHANIARVLDAGMTPEGRPYFALEHVPGLPIIEYCDRQRIDLKGRIEIFQKICHGVQHAHQKGVIHRDLKPTNILVQQRDGFAEPKIIDFGVAKALQQRLTERTLYTEQGRIVGTPEYMSPEQAEMSSLDIDTRSDIYSLGVLLYELLSGQLPFDSRELREAGYFEMQRKIREEEPDRPSTRCSTPGAETADLAQRRRTDPRTLAKSLHGDLDWIVMRCLEKDPARRYQSASELGADLQRYLDDEPVEAGPPSVSYKLRKFLRKRRGAVATAAAIVISLLAGLLLTLWQYGEAKASAKQAKSNEQLAKEAGDKAEQSLARAERELKRQRALNIVAASQRVLGEDPVAALLLSLRAVNLDRSPATLGQVQNAMAEQYLFAEYRGHTGDVTCADFSPLQRRVVTGSADGTVRIWTEDGDQLAVLPQGGPVDSAHFSADEQQILTVAAHGQHRIARVFGLDGSLLSEIGGDGDRPLDQADWHPGTSRLLVRYADEKGALAILDSEGTELRELQKASRPLAKRFSNRLFFSQEGHAVLLRFMRAKIWLRNRAKPIVLVPARPFLYRPDLRNDVIAFDPKDQLIATVHYDNTARLWNTSGELVHELSDHSWKVAGVQFSPSGARILTASSDGTAMLWDRDGRPRGFVSAGGEVLQARFFGSDNRVLTNGWSRTSLWNEKGRRVVKLTTFLGHISDTAPEEGLVLKSQGHRAELWRLGGVEGMHLRGFGDRPWVVAGHPGGQVVSSSDDGRVFAWDRDGKLLPVFDSGVRRPVYGVACSPNGTQIVAGGMGTVYAWDWQTAKPLWSCPIEAGPITNMFFLSDGRIWCHRARSGAVVDPERRKFENAFENRHYSAIAPDRSLIAAWPGPSNEVTFYDARANKLVDFHASDQETYHVAFQPKGKLIGTVSADGTVKLWDRAEVLANPDGVEPTTTLVIETQPEFVEFSPNGTRMLVTTNTRAYVYDLDGNLKFHFWPREGKVGFIHPVTSFSPDGKWIIGKAFDGARRWPAREEDLLRMAHKWADRLGGDRDLKQFDKLLNPVGGAQAGATEPK